MLYNVGFSYAISARRSWCWASSLFGVVLARVRVYAEGAEPPAAAAGFALPGECLQRQALWVLLDALTLVLALQAAVLWWGAPPTRRGWRCTWQRRC